MISPVAKEPRSSAEELSTMLTAMIIVPRPIGTARPSLAPSIPAPMTPSSPAPSAAANTAPTVTSESPTWTTPIRLLTPTARSAPWTRRACRPPARGPTAGAAAVLDGRGGTHRRGTAQPGRGRPDEQRDEGDRGERQTVAAAEMGDRQVEEARRRRDAEQPQGRGPVRIVLRGDAGRRDRGRRTGAEPADHDPRDHERYRGGQGRAAVAHHGQRQSEARRVP